SRGVCSLCLLWARGVAVSPLGRGSVSLGPPLADLLATEEQCYTHEQSSPLLVPPPLWGTGKLELLGDLATGQSSRSRSAVDRLRRTVEEERSRRGGSIHVQKPFEMGTGSRGVEGRDGLQPGRPGEGQRGGPDHGFVFRSGEQVMEQGNGL